MSEPQTEYETEQEIDAEPGFASAPWDPEPPEREDGIAHAHVWGSDGDLVATVCDNPVYGETAYDRARLIAAAGTAAQEARDMGYDPVAVQKALPKILSAAEELLERVEDDCRVRNITPYDEPSFTALEYALKSAEGSGE